MGRDFHDARGAPRIDHVPEQALKLQGRGRGEPGTGLVVLSADEAFVQIGAGMLPIS